MADLTPTRSVAEQAPSEAAARGLPEIGGYRILERIGSGGMGEVYRAEQREPVRREVAVKLVRAGLDSREVLARFAAERQALAIMDHPHIARVFDGGTDSAGRPYFVMEYVRGRPLGEYCDDKRLSIEDRLRLFQEVCGAIEHAHQKGVIHRDLKPSNILVSTQDGQPHAKVIDFGVAKALSRPLTDLTLYTAQGGLLGTPAYMSPEQAAGSQDIDTRSDVYSLGVVLYELLSGTTPFDLERLRHASWLEVVQMLRDEEPPRPSTRVSTLGKPAADAPPPRSTVSLPKLAQARAVSPGALAGRLSGELDWIVMKALEKDRSRRYATPGALAADIGRHLAGEPVEAAPPGLGYRAGKFIRRHRAGLAVAAAAVLAILGTTAATLAGLVQTRRALAAEAAARLEAENSAAEARAATAEATAAARDASRSAALADARSFIHHGDMPTALRRLEDAEALGLRYPDRLMAGEFLAAARGDWALAATLPVRATVACFVAAAGDAEDTLVATSGRKLTLLSLGDGSRQAAESPLTIRGLHPLAGGRFAAVHADSLSLWCVRGDLRQIADVRFERNVTSVSAADDALAVITDDGLLRLLQAPDLAERHRWTLAEIRPDLPPNRTRCFLSPDGQNVFLHAKPWHRPTAWLRTDRAAVNLPLRVSTMEFERGDKLRFLTWFLPSRSGGLEDQLYRIEVEPSPDDDAAPQLAKALRLIPSEQTKGHQALCVDASGFRAFGNTGLVFGPFGGQLTGLRYDQLWPTSSVRFAAAARRTEAFAIAAADVGLLVFTRDDGGESGSIRLSEWCTTPLAEGVLVCRDGALAFIRPGDRAATASIAVELPEAAEGRDWTPVAIDVSLDGRRGAILAQESDGSGFVITSWYGRKALVLYELAGGGREPGSWTRTETVPMPEFDGTHGFTDACRVKLSPDGGQVVVVVKGQAVWHDLEDGRRERLGTHGQSILSDDGRWAALGTENRKTMNILDVSTGMTVATIATAGDGCFSTDGRLLLVADGRGTLRGLDRETGAERFERKTPLIPRAWPATGDWFAGMLREQGGGAHSLFLADKETMAADGLLTRLFHSRSQAVFSPDLSWVFFDEHRWQARLIPVLSMADMRRRLATPLVGPAATIIPAEASGSVPTGHENLSELAAEQFSDRLGEVVQVAGAVKAVKLVAAGNAANVTLATKEGPLLVWIQHRVFPDIAARFDLSAEGLNGRLVTVRGPVELYGGHSTELHGLFQVVVETPDDFDVVESTPAPAASPALTAEIQEFAAADAEAIRRATGATARVSGQVVATAVRVGRNELSFVNFSSDRKGFTVVILRTALPAFEAAFGAELEQLRGQDVVVEGTVSLHKEAPQIILADPAQIRLVERP